MKSITVIVGVVIGLVLVLSLCIVAHGPPTEADAAGPVLYAINTGTYFQVSASPLVSAEASSTMDNNRFRLDINSSGYADAGIVLYFDGSLTLGNLGTVEIAGTGADYAANLWLDVGGDNHFFSFDTDGKLQDLNGDTYGTVANSSSGLLHIDDTSTYTDMDGYGTHTVAELKSGSLSWVSSSTRVAIWIGISGTNATETTYLSAAAPTVTLVNPDHGTQGDEALSVAITGTGFVGLPLDGVSFGLGITVDSFTVVSATEITANISIDGSAATGTRDVKVTNAVGTGTLPAGFTVNAAGPAPDGWYEQFTTNNYGRSVWKSRWDYQTFTPSTTHNFNTVALYLYKVGSPTYNVTIALYGVDADHKPVLQGGPLCSTTFTADTLTTTKTWRTYSFYTGYQVFANTEYALVLSGDGGSSGIWVVVRTATGNLYTRGSAGCSQDSGSTWAPYVPAEDIAFKEGSS